MGLRLSYLSVRVCGCTPGPGCEATASRVRSYTAGSWERPARLHAHAGWKVTPEPAMLLRRTGAQGPAAAGLCLRLEVSWLWFCLVLLTLAPSLTERPTCGGRAPGTSVAQTVARPLRAQRGGCHSCCPCCRVCGSAPFVRILGFVTKSPNAPGQIRSA